jgi:transketolase
MGFEELKNIANILRRDSLISTSAAGSGHPTSCLSCAEIMSVLFFHEMHYDPTNPLNSNNDEFVLSKGHAAPILYSALFRAGCIKEDLNSLRNLNSNLEGHPIPNSLKWIKVATGSLGQGLSVGVGMAIASKFQGKDFRVFVLMGDSETAEGSVYEALQLASYYQLNNLTAIVDVNRLGQRGQTMLGHEIEKYKKRFEGFGWEIIDIDGHNVKEIIKALEKARSSKNPVLILAKTYKGKGVSFLENQEGWHGRALNKDELAKALNEIPETARPQNIVNSPLRFDSWRPVKKETVLPLYHVGEERATRSAYGDALSSLTLSDSSILVLDAEVSNSTFSEKVKSTTPHQFLECFIAEQNMVGVALGLSVKGFNVFASSFSSFLSRAHDQIRMSALSNANMTFCGSHSGVSIGEDGASQMGLEDISMFRALPNSIVLYPCDAVSTIKLTALASSLPGIKYIRTTRPKSRVIYGNKQTFPLGEFKVLRKSSKDDLVVAGSGITVHEALKAHKELKIKKQNTAVVDLYCIKPFDYKKFKEFVNSHGKRLIVVEDHYSEGGIGEMIASSLIGSGIKMKHLCIKEIPHSGKPEELLNKYKIDNKAIIESVKGF